jgi:hypothetical protein
MSLSSSLSERHNKKVFNEFWIEKIFDNYGNDIIKFDFDKTNELYKFILENYAIFAKKPIQIIPTPFFITSCFIYTFPWKNNNSYKAIKDGLLYENSANCKFTIANINHKNTFIKVVNIDSNGTPDYIIIDIMNCILLEILYEKTKLDPHTLLGTNIPDIFTNYTLTDFVNKFETSFSSYSTTSHWNYNNLMKKKYLYNSFCQNKSSDNYDEKCHIYMTNAINGTPETLYALFENYKQNQQIASTIIKYLNSLKHVYNYIYFMGFHFGFLHNDLHQGNLLFDTYIEKITIIDYGRNYIGYFYENSNIYIDNCVKNYYKILNYQTVYPHKPFPNSYKDMIDNYENGFTLRSIVKSTNNGYMTHILDIITLSLSTLYYLYLLKNLDYFYHSTAEQYDKLFLRLTNIIYFETILINGSNDYDALKNKNIKISLRNPAITEYEIVETYIITKLEIIRDIANGDDFEYNAFIYDGLFYTALLLYYFGLNNDNLSHRNGNIFYNSFQINKNSRFINQDNINNFMEYLKYIHSTYNFLSIINIYFKKMSECNIPIALILRGGESNIFIPKIKTIKNEKFKDVKITTKMQEVIDRLNRNNNPPIKPPSFIEITDDVIKKYNEIFKDNIIMQKIK